MSRVFRRYKRQWEKHSRPYSRASMKKKNHLFKYTRKKICVCGEEAISIGEFSNISFKLKGKGSPLRLKKKKNDCKIDNVKRDKEIENAIRKKGKIKLSKLKNVK